MTHMQRREFLAALPCAALGQVTSAPLIETYFLDLVRGYAVNTARTSDTYAVVEYPAATVTKNFLAKSGLSATGVTRMLPALAAWIVAIDGSHSGIMGLPLFETAQLLRAARVPMAV